ncbi:hypothetical protein AALP_AA8G304500 [Arabis alpina]|uniref:Helicase C-terminal domain-containing protein n=1 Tax=Arabis alpina TaxID=50452 RepID=A0A087GAH0_ARAAL|nr:hypothetical protein AALP_AA8G304500 [Arabis alpina]
MCCIAFCRSHKHCELVLVLYFTIDVGHLDVTLHLGFPGSIVSLSDQVGRSGRRERPPLAVYVAFDGPHDQYFMKITNKIFRGTIECCHIDSQNHQNRGYLSFDSSRDYSARIWTYIGREKKNYAESLYTDHRRRKIHSHEKRK